MAHISYARKRHVLVAGLQEVTKMDDAVHGRQQLRLP